MSRHVLILRGSPRVKGNSAVLADQVAAGAKNGGAQVDDVYLHSMDIRPCDACDLCIEQGEGCVIEDDMQALYPKLLQADAIVLASPIYWFTISAQLKLCIDRWYGLQTKGWKKMAGKQVAIILTYGDTDLYTSGGINAIHTFESMFRFLHMNIAGIIHGTAGDTGDVEKQPDLMKKAYTLGTSIAKDAV